VAASGYDRVLILNVLNSIEPFKGGEAQDLALVADAVSGRVTVKAGDSLCAEGEVAETWWVVLDGDAEVTSGGKKIGTIGKNETVGELALFDGGPRSGTVTAVNDLDVLVFDKSTFIDAIAASPPLGLALLQSAARRLRATNALI